MITIFVKKLMQLRGYNARPSELTKVGFLHSSAKEILSGKVTSIKLSTLNNLCVALNCTPNDILNYTNTDGLPPEHALNKITKHQHDNIQEMLTKLSVEELNKFYDLVQNKDNEQNTDNE